MPHFIALLSVLFASAAPAAASPADVRLLPGWRESDRLHVAALEIALKPGWHTYWRAPGAGGIPPRFDWSGSGNLAGARVEWPHPEVFTSFGVRTIGYYDRVVLPILLTPADPSAPIDLRLTLSYGVCKDICIPAESALAARLGPDEAAPETARAAIEGALARRARGRSEAGVVDATCRLAPNGRGMALAATVQLSTSPERAPTAVIEAAARPDLWIGEASARTAGRTVTAEAPVESAGPAGPILDRGGLRLTLIDPARYVEIDGCRAPD